MKSCRQQALTAPLQTAHLQQGKVYPVEGETVCLKHPIRMFVVILATLVFSVRGSNADTGTVWRTPYCFRGFCITLSEGEITAEAGLCVVIPCLFTTGYGFTPQHLVWYKCEPSKQRCGDSDIIFHSNKNNKKVQSGFKGRVSLLEPDVTQGNCSIIVNDLTEFDSGSYQLRVNGKLVGFDFLDRATVSVKGLTQKPTVMIPPLTEGQQTTLTCTAPGLCSGSDPEITWMWGGAGETDSHITGNITAFKTEDLTAVTQRHSSTLTLNPSAKHHSTDITCKVSFANSISTEETVTLNVTYVKEVKITGNTSVKEGEALSLICSVESFPPALITWTKYSDEMQNKTETILQNDTVTDLQTDTVTDLQNDTVTDLQNDTETFLKKSGMNTFSILNVTAADSGLYICTAKHLNNILKGNVNVTVISVTTPVSTATVQVGDALNLTCSIKSSHPSALTWPKHDSNKTLQKETTIAPQSNTGTAALVIINVTAEYSGLYICTAQHQTSLTTDSEVNVTFLPTILSSSACVVRLEVLTHVRISERFPLPTTEWPLLETLTEYSLTTNVSNYKVNIDITVFVKHYNDTTVKCVSNNDTGNLTIKADVLNQEDLLKIFLMAFKMPQVIIAFLIGILLSATICCLARKCDRNKQNNSAETLEMTTIQAVPLISAGHTGENGGAHDQEAAEGGAPAPDSHVEPREVEYSAIDFSMLNRTSSRGAEDTLGTTETEYAEIKNNVTEESQDSGGEEGEMLEGNEEKETTTEEEKETEQCVSAVEEGGEDVAVYSNVNEIMGEM